jgi:hypothetical protein
MRRKWQLFLLNGIFFCAVATSCGTATLAAGEKFG